MQGFGPQSLFLFSAGVYAVFIVIILYRMGVSAGVPAGRRGRFIALLRTSTIFAKLARRNGADGRDSTRLTEPRTAPLDEAAAG